MAEQLRDVEKISSAATQIENALRARQIHFHLVNPANVDPDPALKIEIFWPVCAGICDCVSLTNLSESNRINRLDDAFRLERESVRAQQAERMFSRTGQAPAVYEFAHFMAKLHDHTL